MTGSELLVSETFGPTVQGEGPHVGRRAVFVRLGLCNLSCVWCDAAYTWDWSRFDRRVELERRTVGDLLVDVMDRGAGLVVVTGGEPLVQGPALTVFVRSAVALGMVVHVETNGTLTPSAGLLVDVAHWSVSPKLAHANAGRARPGAVDATVAALALATGSRAWKFVARTVEDLDEAAAFVDRYGLAADEVWVMPEGVDRDTIDARAAELVGPTLERGWNLSGRLHISLWGNERGR